VDGLYIGIYWIQCTAMAKHFARVLGAQPAIPSAHLVTIEADATNGLHTFSIVGLPDKAVEEARDRVASAIKNSGLTSPKASRKKIIVSLAPAALKKEGAAFDMPIAIAYLSAIGEVNVHKHQLFAGELALDGSLRPIHGALSLAQAARRAGIKEIFVPHENAEEAALVDGISVYGVRTIKQLIAHLGGGEALAPAAPYSARSREAPVSSGMVLETIRGQEHAKRALEVAAAGRHNIAFFGPPGTGKTMLARALASLLPPLTQEEIIEVTTIHSYAGVSNGDVVTVSPFRAPHHSSSNVALVGGGTIPKPGEVTLAHRGVLFLDEFPEFARDVINALRQPLEDRVVTVSRARGSQMFPANFTLVVALNPCPCGFYGTQGAEGNRARTCTCEQYSIERYRKKVSGPIADRIDMWVHVGDIPIEDISIQNTPVSTGETTEARDRIARAHKTQQHRYKAHPSIHTNSDLGADTIHALARITPTAEKHLLHAVKKFGMSARGYHRTIKLARTCADLAGNEEITESDMLEALQYRPKEW